MGENGPGVHFHRGSIFHGKKWTGGVHFTWAWVGGGGGKGGRGRGHLPMRKVDRGGPFSMGENGPGVHFHRGKMDRGGGGGGGPFYILHIAPAYYSWTF